MARYGVLVILVVASAQLWAQTVGPQNPVRPLDVTLQVSTRNRQTRFRIGEVINLELQFSSNTANKYQLDTASYDRSGRMNIEQFEVVPKGGWTDPLNIYFHAFAGFMGGGLRGNKTLSSKPESIELQLNEWVRFDQPGHYRVTVDSGRVFVGNFGTVRAPIRVMSNSVELEIITADPQWQEQTLRSAVATLDGPKSPDETPKPGDPDSKRDAIKTLRYLGTPAAAKELAKRLGDDDGGGDLAFGLIGSPSHDAARQEMERLLADPEFGVQGRFVSALSVVALSPTSVSPELPNERSALEAQYRDRMAMSLETKRGKAQVVTANTIVEEAAIRGHDLAPDLKKSLTRVLVANYEQLPERAQANLLQYRWSALDHETAMPLLRHVAQRYKDFPEIREMTAYEYNGASAAALKLWYDLSPAEARPAVVREIMRPRPRFGEKVLGILPDKALPEAEASLVRHLVESDDYDVSENLASLIHRYATATVEPEVIAFLDPRIGKMGCTVQEALLAYLLRVDAASARLRLQAALAARGPDTGCYGDVLTGVGFLQSDPILQELAATALNDPSPSVVASAANYLKRFGDSSVEDALWSRLVEWNAKWGSHASEFHRSNLDKPTDAQQWQGPGQSLALALSAPIGWLADEPRLTRLQALATEDFQRSTAKEALRKWQTQPWTVTCSFGDPIFITILQYEGLSVEDAKRKIIQFPRGSNFVWDETGVRSDIAQRSFEELRSSAAEHGITISRRTAR